MLYEAMVWQAKCWLGLEGGRWTSSSVFNRISQVGLLKTTGET